MLLEKTNKYLQLGVVSLFSIGYYIYPIFLIKLLGLAHFTEKQISASVLLHLIFFVFLVIGFLSYKESNTKKTRNLFPQLDDLIVKHKYGIFYVSFGLFCYVYFTQDLTSYSSQDSIAFLEAKRGPFDTIIKTMGDYSFVIMAMVISWILGAGKRKIALIFIALYCIASLSLLANAQRLAVVMPGIILFVTLATSGQKKMAFKTFFVSILLLLVISPFSVILREHSRGAKGKQEISDAANIYLSKRGLVEQMMISIAERADIHDNSIVLMNYIDRTGFVGFPFYYSVIVNPIPRIFYKNKPYLLSSDGTMSGALANKAWQLKIGRGIGSLTAFGGITAYWEGGWSAVIVDGFLTGILWHFVYNRFALIGIISRGLYAMFFVSVAVKFVPGSFVESLAAMMSLFPLFVILFLLNHNLTFFKRKNVIGKI